MPYVSNFIAHLKSYFIIAYVKVRWLHMSRILDLLTDTNTLSIQGSRIVSQRVIKKSQCPIENFPQSESITHHVTKHITIQFWSNILCRSMLEVSGNWMNITWWIFWESSCIMLGGELRWCLKCEHSWVFLMSLQFWGAKSIVLLYAYLFSFPHLILFRSHSPRNMYFCLAKFWAKGATFVMQLLSYLISDLLKWIRLGNSVSANLNR